MAALTLTAIIDRFQAVLEADPLSLAGAALPFSHDRQPNQAIADRYWIEDGGAISRTSQSNDAEARIDRLTIYIAKPYAFDGPAQFEALETLLDQVYRYLVADGHAQGYNVEADGRRVTNPERSEILIGSLTCRVDYDFNASTI